MAHDDLAHAKRQKNPARDAALTRRFHRKMRRLKPPPRPPDGVRFVVVGWVRIQTSFLDDLQAQEHAQ